MFSKNTDEERILCDMHTPRRWHPSRLLVGRLFGAGHGSGIDVDRIVAHGSAAVPLLCMGIAERWEKYPYASDARIVYWTQALGEIGDSRATPTLIALADHHDWIVRKWAAFAMADIGDERCLPALRRLSQDNDESVATVARFAIDVLQTQGGLQEGSF